jgi:hypothetical protein
MNTRTRLALALSALLFLLMVACSESDSQIAVTKNWINACERDDATSAGKFWSKVNPGLGEKETKFLCDLRKETKFKLHAVEKRDGIIALLQSGEQRGLLGLTLVNSDSGWVITGVVYSIQGASGSGDARSGCEIGAKKITSFAECFWY